MAGSSTYSFFVEASDGDGNIGEAGPSVPESWEGVFRQGLERWQMDFDKLPAKEKKKLRGLISASRGIDTDRVAQAIATLWVPLRKPTGFGPGVVFEIRTRQVQEMLRQAACGQHHNTFLMPLHFDPEQDALKSGQRETKGRELGHIVLAIARRKPVARDGGHKVEIKIYDSRQGIVSEEDLANAAKGVVRYSGWMGMGMSARAEPLVWDIEEPSFIPRPRVEKSYPDQGENSLHCGLYTVLRAWAHLLDINVTKRKTLTYSAGKTVVDFHREGLQIVRLALGGFMDSRTIQAYLRYYGFATGGKKLDLVQDIRAVRMDDNILGEEVENQIISDTEITSVRALRASSFPLSFELENHNFKGVAVPRTLPIC